ncbi:unnamed protein product [Rotaria magnacalcarata]|uniref:Uncharacterized protein n=1 Tax=Rotaria magnacalcarata TaxID=392030 RepID=A0A816BU62_9BILA|nr:unnamed protein product [Rotaria magnacalcarata]
MNKSIITNVPFACYLRSGDRVATLASKWQKEVKRIVVNIVPDLSNLRSADRVATFASKRANEHTIELQPGTKPSNTQPYRLSPSKKAIVDQQLEEMLQAGHISPSRSPWAAPIVLSPKKDGSLRFCVDYRKLNANTIRTAYPMPRVDDTLDSLCQAKYISTLDLRSGYWQVELDPDSRDKTAFITHHGLYEFRVMPFGLSNAPATFQCLMDVAPNFNEPFILETDASDYGLGAILTQEFENQKFVIAYASRTQTAAERNYFPTEKEALAIFWATKHFRPYLEGTTIYIRSDCRALQWLLNTKDLSGRLARWAISLSAFNIVDIKYKPGKTNTNCDTLSRYPLSPHLTILNTTPPTSPLLNLWNNCTLLDNIREEQYNDAQLRPIVDILSNDAHPLHHKFHPPFLLINGILYRYRSPPYNPHQRLTGLRHLLVIPHSLQSQLLTWTHDHPTAGHCGREKTLYRLSSRVYWKTIRKDVIQYIRSCHLCQQYKYDNRTLTASLQMHIVHEPWHTIGVDIMGPFPVTQRQKQYLLVVVDYFTRWVELFPLRTTISSHIADILVDEIICRWGCPTYILSDNGPQFVSELFTHICSSLGIQTKNTSNYHPQTNMTERVNRNLKPMIAQYAQENTHSWDRHLSKLALSIRTSINETTGETPAYLNFGRDPKLPIDLLLTEPSRNQPTLPTSIPAEIDTYKQHLREALLTAHRIAQEHNEVRKLQQKTKYDQHSSHRSFKEGHLVWVSIPSPLKHGKLDPQYQGPCRIIQVLSPTSFIIHRLSDGVNLGATNIDRIKPFYSPNMTHTTTQTGINRHQSAAPIQPLMSVNVDNVNNLPTPHIPPNNHSLPLSSTPLPHRYQHPVRIRKQPNRLNL